MFDAFDRWLLQVQHWRNEVQRKLGKACEGLVETEGLEEDDEYEERMLYERGGRGV